jgi:hypothetical protein
MSEYEFREDAKTFKVEFYYINFLDPSESFDSEYSEKIEDKNHAFNRAEYISKNPWTLSRIGYYVEKVGVYSSRTGHVKSFLVKSE